MKFAIVSLVSLLVANTSAFTTVSNGVSVNTLTSKNSFGVRRWMSSETAVAEPTDVETPSEFDVVRDATVGALKQQLEASKASPELVAGLIYFVNEYFNAMNVSNADGNDVTPKYAAEQVAMAIKLGMTYGSGKDKYRFGVQHRSLRDHDGIDFHKFGCDFFRPAINLDKSPVLGQENLKEAMEFVEQGHNVVLFANHQSEADPQIVSCLMEKVGYGKEAADIFFVAGHKVTTDTLAIPFSMGRNLICIHSKKHIDNDQETKPMKQKQNLMAMSAMLELLKNPDKGSIIWVAPSGGRDRRDLKTNEVPIAPFDQKTIDMFRLMGNKSKQPMHYYSLSMVTYDICPPPDYVEAGTGEQRNVRYAPTGLSFSKELENLGGVESRHLFTEQAEAECQKGYEALLKEIN